MKWRLSTASVATPAVCCGHLRISMSSDRSMNWFAIQTSTSSSCSRQSAAREAVRAAIAAGRPCTASALDAGLEDSAELSTLRQSWCANHSRHPTPVRARLRYLKDLLGDGYVGRVRSVRMHVTVSGFGKNPARRFVGAPSPKISWALLNFRRALDDPLFSIVGRPTEISAVSVNQWRKSQLSKRARRSARRFLAAIAANLRADLLARFDNCDFRHC